MDSMMNIVGGVTVNPDAIKAASESIVEILRVSYETHAEQKTIREALKLLSDSAAIAAAPVTITGCSLKNNPVSTTFVTEADFEDIEDDEDDPNGISLSS